jgi:hypothetical protein
MGDDADEVASVGGSVKEMDPNEAAFRKAQQKQAFRGPSSRVV